MIRSAPAPIRWLLKATGFAGITLPPFGVFVLPDRMNDMRLRRHEEAHWRQYEQRGAVRYYLGYIALWVRYGYWRHPWEQQAREAENDGLHRP